MKDSSNTACTFCKIIENKAPASRLYEDDRVVAFLDLYPLNPGHTLIVPKFHAATLEEIDDAIAEHMMRIAKKTMVAIRETKEIKCSGVNLFMANGRAAGQDVFHCHIHVLPRFENDHIRLHRYLKVTENNKSQANGSCYVPVRPEKADRNELDRLAATFKDIM